MRYRPLLRLAAVGIAALGIAAASHAQVTGYTLVLSGSTNIPTFQLTNNSDPGLTLTAFTVTIGNTAFNYDGVQGVVLGSLGSATLITPDTNTSGGVRSDTVEYTFTGFDPGEAFQFEVDVDVDTNNTTEDYRTVLFNNGAAPNAVVTVSFDNGSVLSQTMPDASPNLTAFTFAQTSAVGAAPEAGTLALLGLGSLPIAGAVIRRRRGR